MKRSERGFTLVEIMIVVAIIALLAAIAIPNVLRGRTTANESAAIGNLRALVSSLEMYRSVYQVYPSTDGTDFRDGMYGTDCVAATNPAPDFGPPSFCRVLDGSAATGTIQGYEYTYASGNGTDYTVTASAVVNQGTRNFVADNTGLIHHCAGNTSGNDAATTDNTIDQQPSGC